jgi:hypothetical protein
MQPSPRPRPKYLQDAYIAATAISSRRKSLYGQPGDCRHCEEPPGGRAFTREIALVPEATGSMIGFVAATRHLPAGSFCLIGNDG